MRAEPVSAMRWLPLLIWTVLVVATVSLFGLVAWVVFRDRLDPVVETAVVVAVDRPGGYVFDDVVVRDWLAGDLEVDDAIVAVGACHSLLGHAGDWSVRPDAVIATRAELVRVAELVETGVVASEFASAIETALLSGVGDDLVVDEIAVRVGRPLAQVEDYLKLRSQAPSAASLERFVVYLQNEKMTVQRLVFVDRVG